MPRKLKVYLDTSVINGLFAYEAPWRIEATQFLLYKIAGGDYKADVSEEVLEEIMATSDLLNGINYLKL